MLLKKINLVILLSFSVLTSAQDHRISTEETIKIMSEHVKTGPYVEVRGRGKHVCVTHNIKTNWPFIARAETSELALKASKEMCTKSKEGNSACTSMTKCALALTDKFETNIERMILNLRVDTGLENIKRFTYQAGSIQSPIFSSYIGSSRLFRYNAFADTALEADALALQLCLSDEARLPTETCNKNKLHK